MKAYHSVSKYKVKGSNDEEPDRDAINNFDVCKSWKEQDGPYKKENSSHEIVNRIENSPKKAILVKLFWLLHLIALITIINKNCFN